MADAALVLQEHAIPDEVALATIEACAIDIERARTLPDIKRVITQAEAIDAVLRKIKAGKEARDAALRLLLDAEVQLGTISKAIPKGRRGGAAQKEPNEPGQTKREIQEASGFGKARMQFAERLANVPKPDLTAAVERAKTKTVIGVELELGIRSPFTKNDYWSGKNERDLGSLATEAIEALERCEHHHKGTIAELRTRLQRLMVRS